jgi:hypothetical protein
VLEDDVLALVFTIAKLSASLHGIQLNAKIIIANMEQKIFTKQIYKFQIRIDHFSEVFHAVMFIQTQ